VPPVPRRPSPALQVEAAEAPAASDTASGAEPAASDAEPAAPRSRRRLVRVLWPVSVAAAIVVTAGATVAVMSLLFPAGGLTASQHEVGTLELSAKVPGQALFGTTTGDPVSATFHGLTVVHSVGGYGGDDDCLTVYQTPPKGGDPSSIEGPISWGCDAGALPALVQVGVDAGSPRALQNAFPSGTGLRFELDGDRVRVIADDFGVDGSAS
jgi:hypothetical protein